MYRVIDFLSRVGSMGFEPDFQAEGHRRSERRAWPVEVQFRAGNRRANVKLTDISKLGARVQGVFLVHQDDRFYIRLPGMESIEAKVAWVTDFEFGCEFERPLNEVVLEALIASQR
jgi:PilZ domain